MQVTLIASTEMHEIPRELFDTKFGRQFNDRDNFYHWEDRHFDADTLAHFSGRACYQAWHMPNEATETDEGYIGNILNQGHFSVLEHASATFYATGVSRNLTHELIRHRHLSYSELSQRYVDMEQANKVIPPALCSDETSHLEPLDPAQQREYRLAWEAAKDAGYTGKEAREAARFYLPSAMETKIVVSGNHRAWRDMLHKRYSVHADKEMQQFAGLLLSELREIAPATYQDFPDEPFS